MSEIENKVDVEEFKLLDFFQRNGLSRGAADLFALGHAGREVRAGEFVAILRGLSDDKGAAFNRIVVILPPDVDIDGATAAVRGHFAESLVRILGSSISPDRYDALFRSVDIVSASSLEGAVLRDLVIAAKPKTAFVIMDAALYRVARVQPSSHKAVLAEDLWTPHLHQVVYLLEEACEASKSYIVVDAGEDPPSRSENRNLLETIKGAVLYAERSGPSVMDLASEEERWWRLAGEGRVDLVLREIDGADLPERNKTVLKARALKLAGADEMARTILETGQKHLDDLAADPALQVAVLAESVEADEVALALLRKAIPKIRSFEFLSAALDLADRLGDRAILAAAEAALSASFPAAPALLVQRAKDLVRHRHFGKAAEVFRQIGGDELETADFFEMLADALKYGGPAEVPARLDAVAQRFPTKRPHAVRFFARDLESRGHRAIAIALAVGESVADAPATRLLVRTAMSMVERGRLMLDATVDNKVVLSAVSAAVAYLAFHPTDSETRVNVVRIASPEVLGSMGIPVVVMMLLNRAAVVPQILPRAPIDDRPKACPAERLGEVIRHGFAAMAKGGTVMGKFEYPAEALTDPPEAVVSGLARLIEHLGQRSVGKNDVRAIEACLLMAVAIAPFGDEPDEDLVVLRLAAGELALAGNFQKARDLAEQGLRMTTGSPHRRRLAWFAFADVYARAGNAAEALVGIACALAADSEATWDQIWYESLLQLRLLRDLNLLPLARPLLEPARRALREMGAENRFAHRLDTIELQLAFAEYTGASSQEASDLVDLAARASRNLERVLAGNDELPPAINLTANILRLAKARGVGLPDSTMSVLEAALSRAGPAERSVLDAVGADDPTLEQVVEVAARMESARYAEDVGYDVRTLVVAARRLLSSLGTGDPGTALYAIEALSDQAAKMPGGAASDRLLDDPAGPAEAAKEISAGGIAVVALGLADDDRLVRVAAVGGELCLPVVEPAAVFSHDRLREWKEKYPYAYRDAKDYTEFFSSTVGIGLSELPERAVIVGGIDLQGYPANLIRIGPLMAGRDRRLAATPSLAWLRASRRSPFEGDGRILAWIPDAAPEEGFPTLAILSERLRETFERHHVALSSGQEPPVDVQGTDLVIVAAHGGVAEDKRYFRVLTDDVNLALASSAVSGALSGAGVVVLFVCSGGRLDQHPGASTTIGLAKRLLDNGCRAVVASPWPLQTIVPPYWLPTFLASWSTSAPVIDACFEANAAARAALGDDPAMDLAMAVYGDPLVRASDR